MGRLQGRRFRQRTAIALIVAVSMLIGFLLAAIVFWTPASERGDEVAEPVNNPVSPFLDEVTPTPGQTPPRLTDVGEELGSFVRDCEKKGDFVPGQTDYPVTLSAKIDQATTYSAAVDIRTNPL